MRIQHANPDNHGKQRSYNARAAAHASKGERWALTLTPMRDDGPAPKTCRFIFNDDMTHPDVCGEPVLKGYSYCKEHKELCMYVWDEKKKRLRKKPNYAKRKSRFS